MFVLSTSQKGLIAEMAIALRAARMGIRVLRPMLEGARYDLAFEVGGRLLRVQCKWASRRGDVVTVPIRGSYHSPIRGYVRNTYSGAEIEGIAAYCDELDACYWLPMERFSGQTYAHLRLVRARNNQRGAVNMASGYEFGAVAQLGERFAGSEEAGGSNPPSSISGPTPLGAHEYRNHFGWYMERAAAGESFLITRRGKPYARLTPPHYQLEIPAESPEPDAAEPGKVVPITAVAER